MCNEFVKKFSLNSQIRTNEISHFISEVNVQHLLTLASYKMAWIFLYKRVNHF